MPVKAIPHPSDEGKWMSNFDDYGHGEGEGKSRNAIYKHFKKINSEPVEEKSEESGDGWIKTDWMDDDSSSVKSKTIPEPLGKMAEGNFQEINMKAQGHIVRTVFVGLDRLITHWGRGVMSDDSWSIERSPEDYDTLQDSTLQLMSYYDISIPITPPAMWAMTVGTAYVPQISHVIKNRDPSRKKKGFFSRIFRRKKKEETKEGEKNE